MPKSKLLLFLTVLVGAIAPDVSAQTALAWKLNAGEQYELHVEQQTSSAATVVNKTIRTSIEMTLEGTWSVESVDAGVAQIRQRVTRAVAKVQAADSPPVEYDTMQTSQPSGAARELAAALKPLVDPESSISLTMNARGEILSAELSPKLAEVWEAGKDEDTGQRNVSASLETLLKQPMVVLPEKEVSAGDKWKTTRELQTPAGKFSQVTGYTYDGPQESAGRMVQAIAFTSTLTPTGAGKTKVKEQSQTGTVLFDADAGRLVSAEQMQKLVTETPYRQATITVIVESQVKRTLVAK